MHEEIKPISFTKVGFSVFADIRRNEISGAFFMPFANMGNGDDEAGRRDCGFPVFLASEDVVAHADASVDHVDEVVFF